MKCQNLFAPVFYLFLAGLGDTYVFHTLEVNASVTQGAAVTEEDERSAAHAMNIGLIIGNFFDERCSEDCPEDKKSTIYQAEEFHRLRAASKKADRCVLTLQNENSAALASAIEEGGLSRLILMGDFRDSDIALVKKIMKEGTRVCVVSNLFFDGEGKYRSIAETFGSGFKSFAPSASF